MKSYELRIARFVRTVELCKGQLELLCLQDLDGRDSITRALKDLISELSDEFFPQHRERGTLDAVMEALDIHFNGEPAGSWYPKSYDWDEAESPQPEGPYSQWAWFYANPETEEEALGRLVVECG